MLVLEQALCEIDEAGDQLVVTPSGHRYKGTFLHPNTKLCGISLQTNVVAANTQAIDSLLSSLQALLNAEGCNLSQFGEVVVAKQNAEAYKASITRSFLPSDIAERYALIVHPTLSTGTSALGCKVS